MRRRPADDAGDGFGGKLTVTPELGGDAVDTGAMKHAHPSIPEQRQGMDVPKRIEEQFDIPLQRALVLLDQHQVIPPASLPFYQSACR
jgi:hypothetical protein